MANEENENANQWREIKAGVIGEMWRRRREMKMAASAMAKNRKRRRNISNGVIEIMSKCRINNEK
jgi:hypothetical protein